MCCGVPFPQCLPTKLDRTATVMMVKYGPRSEKCQHSRTLACRKRGKHNPVSVHLFNEPAVHNSLCQGYFKVPIRNRMQLNPVCLQQCFSKCNVHISYLDIWLR